MRRLLGSMLLLVALSFLSGACAAAGPTPTPTSGVALATNQELRSNLAGEPDNIDPNRASFSHEITVVKQVFEGLLSFDDQLAVVPVVANEVPTVANGGISSDGLTYTFKLRSGVKWSDGKPVTAKDFEYSVKRMLKPETASDYASFYYDIKGALELNSAQATTDALLSALGVQAVDESTLRVTLASPRPAFLQIMALWSVYPVRQDIIEKFADKWTEPPNYVGNGPYVLKEWVHQDHITLEANPNYWGTKPKLQKIVLKMMADENAALAAYKNNEMELVAVPAGGEKAIFDDPVLNNQSLRYPDLVTFALQFNVKKPPFDNKAVRQALSKAIDREAFINQVRRGVGRPTTSWIPPGMPGFDANLGSGNRLNVAAAKDGLAKAGYSDLTKLPPITFQFTDTTGNRTIAQFVQAQFKQNLGIDIKLEPMESKAFQQLIKDNNINNMAFLGWGADYPDPDNWLPELFGTGAGNNHTNYSNPEFDKLAEQAKKELDNTKRLQLWDQAQKLVVDDAPVVFLFNRERFWLKKPNTAGLKTTGMDGFVPGDWFLEQGYITK
ncbi:MAG: peptide ABC transporter substrate-binding protein [Chloroflexi bacterium]|nr:peptide ABC transporter substrate-binding protein [Chloroflexota bacterium]